MKGVRRSLIADLEAQGFEIQEVSDLYNKKYDYKFANPTLIGYLDRELEPALMEEIAAIESGSDGSS